MEFTVQRFDGGMHYFVVETAVAAPFIEPDNKKVLCTINDQHEFHAAFMPKKEGGYYINLGQSIRNQAKIREGSSIRATFRKDHSRYQFQMPEVLAEVLRADCEAEEIFAGLPPRESTGIDLSHQCCKIRGKTD